ncbi:phosphatidylethanolamine-binding protein [Apiosordaria backusii]|uniref:Phosphatidylethanolamine-binding protein n=1 Tax=Apiosordaria backusii TaxID=314023 RepID=A0AA40EMW7_9PEZI|nr:phosphatidylethanolamine-binding protein [Apiosordaria backusii]
MSGTQQVARPLVRSLRQATTSTATCQSRPIVAAIRQFSSTPSRSDETTTTTPAGSDAQKLAADAAILGKKKASEITVIKQGSEEELAKLLSPGLGSIRRRAAIATTGDIPFEQLPYQCFQEARKVLAQDREEKITKIKAELAKIKRIEETDPSTYRGGEEYKQKRLESLRQHVEELKIQADINDPMVKRKFEDGQGDMNKPIYRYLAEKKWRSMDYKIITQRIHQFNIVPDILPNHPRLPHHRRPPNLRMQVFNSGQRLLSVVVMDSDVPNPETDSFNRRLHFLVTNIPWSPTSISLNLHRLSSSQSPSSSFPPPRRRHPRHPLAPPTAQKGAPYHRLSVFVLEHPDNKPLDLTRLQNLYAKNRDGFSLKSFRDKFNLNTVGFTLFRSVWDEHTAEVMARHGIPGADVEFKQPRVRSLKPPRKARGWEAKRQKPKYKSLWKYSKRIKGLRY